MSYIPHDYYLRFMDSNVHAEVLEFHAKGNYTIHNAVSHSTRLHNLSEKQLSTLTGNELRLYPDMDLTFAMRPENTLDLGVCRNESCELFPKSNLDFSIIEGLMSPVLSSRKGSFKRGYPSGGALYPAEIFICSLDVNDESWPCAEKVLHVLPHSRGFEVVQGTHSIEDLRQAILTYSPGIGLPNIAIVYVAYMPKTLFKYRYRGYRLALMEVGSIYMLIELQAKKMGLHCRLWSAYTDTMLCKSLGLNPALFFPMCVHLIGGSHEPV